jgi:hypothetical protein
MSPARRRTSTSAPSCSPASLRVETREGVIEVAAGQAVIAAAGEWVRYGTPSGPAEYISVCVPAFTPATVHRDG